MTTVLVVGASALLTAWTPAQAASNTKPVISGLTASPPKVTKAGESSTISATISGASACKVSSTPALLSGAGAVPCGNGTVTDTVLFPTTATMTVYLITVTAKGAAANASMTVKVKVRPGAGGGLAGVQSMASDGEGSCALLVSSMVDCWGYGPNGQLGNGQFYASNPFGSATPVPVQDVSGSGTLSGVTQLIGDTSGDGYCALLNSGGVDCWGFGQVGDLGDGLVSDSATPVQVLSVDGSGVLADVSSLVGDGMGYCAVLTSGEVDCWGYGPNGELGDGQFYATAPFGSAVPVQVEDEAGDGGVLTGVSAVTGGDDGYCAVLTSDEVDCWGGGSTAIPTKVDGIGGNGVLFGVASVTGDATGSYCALLADGTMACWGVGGKGELGDGAFGDSATPVQVDGLGGDGVLTGVADVTSDQDGFCALLTAGGVNCWGNGTFGLLGNGKFSNSAVPVQVGGVAENPLHRATALTGDGNGFCALLNSSDLACWGAGPDGDLGNGQYYPSGQMGSATPVAVEGLGGVGTLSGVTGVTGGGDGYCALLNSSEVDCWGSNDYGNLGNGQFTPSSPFGSALPVQVL